MNHLLDHAIDLSHFDARFQNDATGAPAYPLALLLKVVLFAYSRRIVSSRQIERACQEHVTFIALCGDRAPHFTTIAKFKRGSAEQDGDPKSSDEHRAKVPLGSAGQPPRLS